MSSGDQNSFWLFAIEFLKLTYNTTVHWWLRHNFFLFKKKIIYIFIVFFCQKFKFSIKIIASLVLGCFRRITLNTSPRERYINSIFLKQLYFITLNWFFITKIFRINNSCAKVQKIKLIIRHFCFKFSKILQFFFKEV